MNLFKHPGVVVGDVQFQGAINVVDEIRAASGIELIEMVAPIAVVDTGIIYTKDMAGATELFYMDSAGNEVQLTSGGAIPLVATLDIIPDGPMTYGKVRLTSLVGGEVVKLTDAAGDDLTIALAGLNRVLTMTGNAALNQDLQDSASPTFAGLTLGAWNGVLYATAGAIAAGDLDNVPDGITYGRVKKSSLVTGEVVKLTDAGGDDLTVALGGANRLLTITADSYLNQDVRTTGLPTFAGLVLTDTLSIGTVGVPYVPTSGNNIIEIYALDSACSSYTDGISIVLSAAGGAGGGAIRPFQGVGRAQATAVIDECYGGSFYAIQDDGSRITENLYAVIGWVSLDETDDADCPDGYLAGLVGIYQTDGIDPSTSYGHPGAHAAVMGVVKDGLNNKPNGVVMAILEGDDPAKATYVNAAFKAINIRTTVGTGYNYGLDLYNEAGIGTTIIPTGAAIRLQNGNLIDNPSVDLITVDCDFEMTGSSLIMNETADPADEANKGKLYVKDAGGVSELFYMDDAANVLQISNAGSLNFGALSLDDISDGVTYGRVHQTSLSGNEVVKLTDLAGDDMTVVLGGADRILTLGASVSLNQSLQTSDTPSFVGLNLAGNISDLLAVNDGNPYVQLGASVSEYFWCQARYATGTQDLDYISFYTATASATADRGRYNFNVDGTDICIIDDDGIELYNTGLAYYIGDSGTNGSWRIIINGTNLEIQKRESGSWVAKAIIEA